MTNEDCNARNEGSSARNEDRSMRGDMNKKNSVTRNDAMATTLSPPEISAMMIQAPDTITSLIPVARVRSNFKPGGSRLDLPPNPTQKMHAQGCHLERRPPPPESRVAAPHA